MYTPKFLKLNYFLSLHYVINCVCRLNKKKTYEDEKKIV